MKLPGVVKGPDDDTIVPGARPPPPHRGVWYDVVVVIAIVGTGAATALTKAWGGPAALMATY